MYVIELYQQVTEQPHLALLLGSEFQGSAGDASKVALGYFTILAELAYVMSQHCYPQLVFEQKPIMIRSVFDPALLSVHYKLGAICLPVIRLKPVRRQHTPKCYVKICNPREAVADVTL